MGERGKRTPRGHPTAPRGPLWCHRGHPGVSPPWPRGPHRHPAIAGHVSKAQEAWGKQHPQPFKSHHKHIPAPSGLGHLHGGEKFISSGTGKSRACPQGGVGARRVPMLPGQARCARWGCATRRGESKVYHFQITSHMKDGAGSAPHLIMQREPRAETSASPK